MTKEEKWRQLESLAFQDETYLKWKQKYNQSAVRFGRFIRWCPPSIRNFLYDYADSGRLMMQRMAGIALENMEFREE